MSGKNKLFLVSFSYTNEERTLAQEIGDKEFSPHSWTMGHENIVAANPEEAENFFRDFYAAGTITLNENVALIVKEVPKFVKGQVVAYLDDGEWLEAVVNDVDKKDGAVFVTTDGINHSWVSAHNQNLSRDVYKLIVDFDKLKEKIFGGKEQDLISYFVDDLKGEDIILKNGIGAYFIASNGRVSTWDEGHNVFNKSTESANIFKLYMKDSSFYIVSNHNGTYILARETFKEAQQAGKEYQMQTHHQFHIEQRLFPEKRYMVIDHDGADLMSDTYNEPLTVDELRERFWGLEESFTEETEFEDFSVNDIAEIWNVGFEIVRAKYLDLNGKRKPENYESLTKINPAPLTI